ncbi:MAG: TIGR03621 family F420-dependent LLM class oxidoreductase [Actinomycetota bacterium]
MATRPFRFSTQAFAPTDAAEWTETARKAESLGYDCLHLADHYLGPGEAATAASHPVQTVAAIPAMAAAAMVTDTIKIGCRVLCVDYHQPMVLAKSLATIDLLSNGRLEAGYGAGWITSEYEAMGVPMDPPGVRIDRLIEHVELGRSFFAGEELAHRGTHVTATSMAAIPPSPQEGGPRIMIGGGGKRVLRTAARLADIVSLNFNNSAGRIGPEGIGSSTAELTAEKIGWVRHGAGDRYDDLEIEIGAYFTAVTDDTAGTLAAMGGAMGMDADTMADYPHALIGSTAEIVETLQKRRELYDISYINVAARNMEAFAPVVAELTGT